MKKHHVLFGFAMLTCIALFIFVGCDNAGTTAKDVKIQVMGKAVSTGSRAVSPDFSLASGGLAVNDIPVDLQWVDSSANSNNAEFEATVTVEVPVKNPKIRLSATPKAGFVFDEWRVDKKTAKTDGVWKKVKLTDSQEESFTIEIDPDHAKYYTATFEPGFYVDLENGDDTAVGSYRHPFKTIDQAMQAVSTAIDTGKETADYEDDDFDEFVLIVSGTSSEKVVIAQEVGISIKGGYASDWSAGGPAALGAVEITSSSKAEDIEISNVKIDSLTFAEPLDELTGCEIGTLTYNGSGAVVVANTKITGQIKVPQGSTFVNCILVGASFGISTDCNFYHCLMPKALLLPEAAGTAKNNIVVGSTVESEGVTGANYLLTDTAKFTIGGYRTDDSALVAALKLASGFTEAEIEDLEDPAGIDDDFLEEDITGFERPELEQGQAGNWSFGPYEYIGR